ncbi:Bromodomain-like superfamily [Sesbania bispinosa]|nr:Bromodomain-like superfamily [Sesbania bispinosa]
MEKKIVLVGDFSDSESTLQESNIDSDESGRASQNDQLNYSKGKEVSLYESEDTKSHELTETHVDAMNRRRLVLKFPIRDSSKPMHEFDNQAELVGSSSKTAQEATDYNQNRLSSKDPGYYFGNGSHRTIERTHQVKLGQVADHVDLLGKIRWGMVRARSSKPLRVGEAMPSDANPNSVKCPNHLNEKENVSTGHEKEDKDFSTSTPALDIQNDDDKVDSLTEVNENCTGTASQPFNPTENGEALTASSNCRDKDESLVSACMIPQDNIPAFISHSGADQLPEPNIGFPSVSTKQGLKGRVVVVEDDNNTRVTSNQGENGSPDVDAQVKQISTSHDSPEPHSHRDKMYKAVYRRSRSHRTVTNLTDGSGLGESTSNGSNSNCNAAVDFSNGINEALHTNGSLELEPTTCDPNNEQNNLKEQQQQGNGSCMVRSPQNVSTNRGQLTEEGATKGSWLLLSTHEEGCRYIPQQGDEVVYLRQGHQEYIEYSRKRESGPWISLKGHIRAVEYCRIQSLEYSHLPGSEPDLMLLCKEIGHAGINAGFGGRMRIILPVVGGKVEFCAKKPSLLNFQRVHGEDRHGLHELKKISNKSKFINRFPVPLSLELIQSRLENNYYRSLEALKHDVSVLLSNATSFLEKDATQSAKIQRLSEWFTRTLSSL